MRKNMILITGITVIMLSLSGCDKEIPKEGVIELTELDGTEDTVKEDAVEKDSTDAGSMTTFEDDSSGGDVSEGKAAYEFEEMLIGKWEYSGSTNDTQSADNEYDGSKICISIAEDETFTASYENAEFCYSYNGTWKTFMQGENVCIEFTVSDTDDEAVMLQNTLGGYMIEKAEDDDNTISLIQISNGGSIFAEYFGDCEPVLTKTE